MTPAESGAAPLKHPAGAPVPADLDATSTPALDAAVALGIPREVFVAICDWLEEHPVESAHVATRYAPNTRAAALRACRLLALWKADGYII